jgi:thiamine pyridinylase
MKERNMRRLAVSFAITALFLEFQCAIAADLLASNRFQLRVSLYPWIPYSQELADWIKKDFEKDNPQIELVIRPMVRADDADLAYDVPMALAALLIKDHNDFQHVVEIDTMILGQLVQAGAVVPFEVARSDYLPFTRDAVSINQQTYGVPHWTCGYFLMSESQSITEAKTAQDLMTRLNALGSNKIKMGGKLEGSWDSVIVYIDAYLDTYPDKSAADALKDKGLDVKVLTSLRYLKDACTSGGKPYCNKSMAAEFGRGELTALVGYSERLNSALSQDNAKIENVHISPAPLGEGSRPFLFTDALVLSRHCDSDPCRDAAKRFAEYYVSDRVFEVALMALETQQKRVPRYLLPSTTGAFGAGKVAQDSIYKQLRAAVAEAKPYPNIGIPEARSSGLMRIRVNEALGNCPNLICN